MRSFTKPFSFLLISTLALLPANAQKLADIASRPVASPLRTAPQVTGAVTATVGANWVSSSATGPAARSSAMMAYDAATRTVVLFGGYSNSGLLADTWVWDGVTWTQKAVTGPPARYQGTMAYDAATGTVVLFGGSTGATYLNDTWTWDGSSWTQQTTPAGLTARIGPQMAYDAATQSIVLFGGYVSGVGNQSDTWTWNGAWTQQTYSTSPGARAYAGMAYDAATSSVILFGGNGSSGLSLSDTWLWTSAGWSQQSPASSPSARHGAAMAYDPLTQTVVLFGGANTSPFFGDTWSWNGTNWTAQTPATNPSARLNPALAYIPSTKSLVLFGGVNSSGSGLNDTWNYDAAAFAAPSTAVSAASPSPTPVFFTITTAGTLPALSNSNVLTQGAPGLDFTLGTGSTCSGSVTVGTCVVYVNFTPQAPGQRLGAVSLLDSSNNILATAYLSGIGTAPMALYQSGPQSTIASNLNTGRGLTVDAAGNVYIANESSKNVVVYPAGSTTPTTLATLTDFTGGTAVDGAGNVFVTTASSGLYEIPFGSSTATRISNAHLFLDNNLSADGAGNIYASDENRASIFRYSPPSYAPTTLYTGDGSLRFVGMAVDTSGNIFAADFNNGGLYELPAGSSTLTTLHSGSPLIDPHALAVDAAGDVYVANNTGTDVYRFAAGNYATPVTTGMQAQHSLAVGSDGSIYGIVNGLTLYKYKRTSPPTLIFANTAVGSSSAAQTVTLENDGNAPLTFPIPGSGQNPSQSNFFTLGNTSTCITLTNASSNSVSLAAGANCTEVISYTPTVSGAVTGNLIFTDNSLNATYATQTVVETGTTTSTLNVSVVGQNVPQGTSSITLEFTVGYGGNTAPTGTPTLTVNGSATNVGTVTCRTKVGHNNCTATYNPSPLAPGTYSIVATQPADSSYATAASASATLTITGAASYVAKPVKGAASTHVASLGQSFTPSSLARPVITGAFLQPSQPGDADPNTDASDDSTTQKTGPVAQPRK